MYTFLLEHLFSILLGIFLGMELLGHMGNYVKLIKKPTGSS